MIWYVLFGAGGLVFAIQATKENIGSSKASKIWTAIIFLCYLTIFGFAVWAMGYLVNDLITASRGG